MHILSPFLFYCWAALPSAFLLMDPEKSLFSPPQSSRISIHWYLSLHLIGQHWNTCPYPKPLLIFSMKGKGKIISHPNLFSSLLTLSHRHFLLLTCKQKAILTPWCLQSSTSQQRQVCVLWSVTLCVFWKYGIRKRKIIMRWELNMDTK